MSQASGSADVARVPESVPEDTFVAHVVVSDADEGRNGRFECTLAGDSAENSFRLMTVAEGEYQLLTAAVLDREHGDEYRLSVICEDGGQPPLMSSATLLVQVRITAGGSTPPRPWIRQYHCSMASLPENCILCARKCCLQTPNVTKSSGRGAPPRTPLGKLTPELSR